ncbi:MAG: outer membrane protein assembly factor BamB family protein [Planctomycetota bacterium]|jgi:outer membrane protein assembly factor BamB
MAKKDDMPDWLDEEDLFDDDEGDVFEEDSGPKKPSVLKRGGGTVGEKKSADDDDDSDADEEKKKEPSALARMAMKHQKRPGEQEAVKSPLVLTLGAAALALAVAAGAYWFIIGRKATEQELAAIDSAVSEQRYAQAIASLDDFLLRHGRDRYTVPATVKRAKVRIDKEIAGSAPAWDKGLEALNLYIEDVRDFEEYKDEYPALAEYSEKIALGALESAAKLKREELLAVSDEADVMIDRFSDPENPPVELHEQVKREREKAVAAINKHQATQNTYAEIEKFLERKQPLEALKSRRRLLDRYSDLVTDRKLNELREKTLETERNLVAGEDLKQEASREDRPLPVPPPLSLTLHTRARTDEESAGRTVFAVAQGCVYGIDTVTGDPVWRRSVGPDTPFFPIEVDTVIPGLLYFDTTWRELVLVNRLTGELAWRQTLDEPVSGEPLIHNGQVYLPTLGNHLYKIELESGTATSRLTFSQPVYSPPALTRDQEYLVIAGDEAVCYSVSTREMDCEQVSFIGQRPGTIDVPLLPMGELVLMVENDRTNSAQLRVLDASAAGQGLRERASVRIDRLVRDRPVLRGNQLFVPAEGEQFNVFTVSDDPEKEPLSPIAKPPKLSDYSGPVHVLPGADGMVWSAGDHLRLFQLSQDSLLEDQQKRVFIGAAAQPVQNIGRMLFVGWHQLASDSVALIQYDGESMTDQWKTVVGSGLLQIMPSAGNSAICLTKSGELFQVTEKELEQGGFHFQPNGVLELPPELTEPLHAGNLPNQQMAVSMGGQNAKLFFVNQAGKVGQEFPMEAGAVLNPVPVAGGAVVPLAAKLRVAGVQGSLVEDYLGTIEQTESVQWVALLPIDDNHVLIVDREGRVSRLQYRTSPSAHLQQIDTIELGEPVDVTPVVSAGRVVLADASGSIRALNAAGFERLAETKLDAPVIGNLAVAGDLVLAEDARGTLHCLDLTQDLKEAWTVSLNGDHLSGTPLLQDGRLIATTMNGTVRIFDAASGQAIRTAQLDQPLEHGPIQIGKYLIVASIDGSLYRIDDLLGGEQ